MIIFDQKLEYQDVVDFRKSINQGNQTRLLIYRAVLMVFFGGMLIHEYLNFGFQNLGMMVLLFLGGLFALRIGRIDFRQFAAILRTNKFLVYPSRYEFDDEGWLNIKSDVRNSRMKVNLLYSYVKTPLGLGLYMDKSQLLFFLAEKIGPMTIERIETYLLEQGLVPIFEALRREQNLSPEGQPQKRPQNPVESRPLGGVKEGNTIDEDESQD
jgi:hypothetical protein